MTAIVKWLALWTCILICTHANGRPKRSEADRIVRRRTTVRQPKHAVTVETIEHRRPPSAVQPNAGRLRSDDEVRAQRDDSRYDRSDGRVHSRNPGRETRSRDQHVNVGARPRRPVDPTTRSRRLEANEKKRQSTDEPRNEVPRRKPSSNSNDDYVPPKRHGTHGHHRKNNTVPDQPIRKDRNGDNYNKEKPTYSNQLELSKSNGKPHSSNVHKKKSYYTIGEYIEKRRKNDTVPLDRVYGVGSKRYRSINKNNTYALMDDHYKNELKKQIVIGAGSFGSVLKVKSRGGRWLAMKCIKKAQIDYATSKQPDILEDDLPSSINSPYVLRVQHRFQDKDHFYLLTDFAEHGDGVRLTKRINSQSAGPRREDAISSIVYMVMLALGKVHEREHFHRDIKPDNLLFFENHVALSDFGLATSVDFDSKIDNRGTLDYLSPEYIFYNDFDERGDIYAVGMTAYIFAYGRHPFMNEWDMENTSIEMKDVNNPYSNVRGANSRTAIYKEILWRRIRAYGRGALSIAYGDSVSREGIAFLKKCLANRPQNRFRSVIEALEHPWIVQYMLGTKALVPWSELFYSENEAKTVSNPTTKLATVRMNSSGGWPSPPTSPRSPISVTFEDQAQLAQRVGQQPRKDSKGRRIHFHDDHRPPDDGRRRRPSVGFWEQVLKLVIETRCTERVSWTLSAAIGFLVLAMQIPPIALGDWVHIYEPRAINRTDDKGDTIELPFYFNLGYFRACRWALANLSVDLATVVDRDFPPRCVWNSIFTGEDLTDFSFASNAILVRLGPSVFFHTFGSALTMLAFALSVNGHVRRNAKTLCAAIVYFVGGLSVMGGVLQLICVVDDEMYPRMRPTPSGEPSRFFFSYGLTFLVAALSFLPIQICIYLQTSAFFNRFPEPRQKATIVPGLNKLLQQVSLIPVRTHQLGRFAIMPAAAAVPADPTAAGGESGLSASVSAASSLSAGGGGPVGTRRRESRISSRDLSGSPWTVHQEVRNADILTAYAIRRPSSQLYLA